MIRSATVPPGSPAGVFCDSGDRAARLTLSDGKRGLQVELSGAEASALAARLLTLAAGGSVH